MKTPEGGPPPREGGNPERKGTILRRLLGYLNNVLRDKKRPAPAGPSGPERVAMVLREPVLPPDHDPVTRVVGEVVFDGNLIRPAAGKEASVNAGANVFDLFKLQDRIRKKLAQLDQEVAALNAQKRRDDPFLEFRRPLPYHSRPATSPMPPRDFTTILEDIANASRELQEVEDLIQREKHRHGWKE